MRHTDKPLLIPMMVVFVIVLNAAPQGHMEASVIGPKGNASNPAGAAPHCRRLMSLFNEEPAIQVWCHKTVYVH